MARRFLLMIRHVVVVVVILMLITICASSSSLKLDADESVPEPQVDTAHQEEDQSSQHESVITSDTTVQQERLSTSPNDAVVGGLTGVVNDDQQQDETKTTNHGGVNSRETLMVLSEEEMNLYFEEDERLVVITKTEPLGVDSGTSTAPKMRLEFDESEDNANSIPNDGDDRAVEKAESILENNSESFLNATTETLPSEDSTVNAVVVAEQERDVVETAPTPPRTTINNCETRIIDHADTIKTSRAMLLGALAQSFVRSSTVSTSRARRNKQDTGLTNHKPSNDQMFEYCRRPPCGFWGDPQRETRTADPAILEGIIRDMQKLEEEETVPEGGNVTEVPVEPEEVTTAPPVTGGQEIPEDHPTAEAKATIAVDDLVEGCDDLDKLFEGVTTPDEFDVASNGSTIQEVIMGSATKVVLKRISVAARIAKTKTLQAIRTIVQQVRQQRNQDDSSMAKEKARANEFPHDEFRPFQFWRDSEGNIAPLRRLRNEQGRLVPLQSFRKALGDKFAPLQRFRNADTGNFAFPSKEAVWNGVKVGGRMLLRGIRRIEAIIDPIFEGSFSKEDDDDDTSLSRSLEAKRAPAE